MNFKNLSTILETIVVHRLTIIEMCVNIYIIQCDNGNLDKQQYQRNSIRSLKFIN